MAIIEEFKMPKEEEENKKEEDPKKLTKVTIILNLILVDLLLLIMTSTYFESLITPGFIPENTKDMILNEYPMNSVPISRRPLFTPNSTWQRYN